MGDPVPEARVDPPPRAVLRGAFVTLEPIDPSRHAEGLFGAGHGSPAAETLWTYMPYGPFADVASMRAWLQTLRASEDPLFFAVLRDGRPVGMTSFLNVDTTMRRLEIGHIWYGPAAQRTEANTEACLLMLGWAFDAGYRRVEWKCDALNARSRVAAERLGFVFEGVFRRHMIVKGRNRDTAWYALLDDQWRDVRVRLAARLSASS
ncbi:MAG: GNAT family N-acetyltransferase [Actinobacteria bacterium]|nr:GNAT family N-acetyltransferase [Actinomycetota bacterium]